MTLTRVTLWLSLLLLTACATRPVYAPAEEPDDPGYWETRISENRYRVSFVGQTGTPSDQVKNYALLRAAELTQNAGYDWFRIVDRETEEKQRSGEPRVSLGIGGGCHPFGCRIIGSRWYTGVHLDSRRYADRYRTSMEIVMGKGPADEPNNVYNAKELSRYLRDNDNNLD